jgi:hypothetical protein
MTGRRTKIEIRFQILNDIRGLYEKDFGIAFYYNDIASDCLNQQCYYKRA